MEDNYTDSDALNDARKIKNLFRPFEHFEGMLAKVESAKSEETIAKKNLQNLEDTRDKVQKAVDAFIKERKGLDDEIKRDLAKAQVASAESKEIEKALEANVSKLKAQEAALSKSTQAANDLKKKITDFEAARKKDMASEEARHQQAVNELKEIKRRLDTDVGKLETRREEFRREALGG